MKPFLIAAAIVVTLASPAWAEEAVTPPPH